MRESFIICVAMVGAWVTFSNFSERLTIRACAFR